MADAKKIWVVKHDVSERRLEDELNELAQAGYQLYKMYRHQTDLESLGGIGDSLVHYTLVVFHVGLLAAKQQQEVAAATMPNDLLKLLQGTPQAR